MTSQNMPHWHMEDPIAVGLNNACQQNMYRYIFINANLYENIPWN